MTENSAYWQDLVSTALRYLQDEKNSDAVNVIKNSSLNVEFDNHDNWNGGIDYWNIVFTLKYDVFIVIRKRKPIIEEDIYEAIRQFHSDSFNPIANVSIRPIVERFIDWSGIYPETKKHTIQLIEEEQKLLTEVATGKIRFKDGKVEEEYKKRHNQIMDLANRAGFSYPVPERTLSAWWDRVKKLKTYSERRTFINAMFDGLLSKLNNSYEGETDLHFNNLSTNSEAVKKAIEDAELFIREGKTDSAVDRIHSAFHGYLQELLMKHNVAFSKDDSLSALFSKLYGKYKEIIQPDTIGERVKTILRSGAGIIRSIDELRNNNTIVHPNGQLIQKREALLVLRFARAIMEYIENIESQLIVPFLLQCCQHT